MDIIGGIDYDKIRRALKEVTNTQMFDRVTEDNEFVASGIEVAFNSYEIDSGFKTRVDGVLVTDTISGDGILFGDGVVESYT